MKDALPNAIHLEQYQVPDFLIEKTDLSFDLYDDYTEVVAKLSIKRNPASSSENAPLVLNGQELLLKHLEINGTVLSESDYELTDDSLIIENLQSAEALELKTVVYIKPQENTSLEGLYRSRTMYCTQCEAEGFRKITYYLDRPDVMSEFTTRVSANKSDFPVLLSNGNKMDGGDLEGDRHFAVWHDPFKKPAYLFALVAGDLEHVEDTFTTCSGRTIDLKIYVEAKDLDKCDHAMKSLKNSMKWDEEVYGREYDLDIFMIVAVDDFNMGAMENKGLNIFNTSCVLASEKTTTDAGFQRVEAVVAHEYFHNWSGNRVTCRDWFQLSLKEGFTVFRDSEFSADMGSRTVKRVEDVSLLRTLQFAEDGGPMAHPVRPASYIEISNFYTLTVYEKGAEVVRMIHTLLGAEVFRKGSDLYFDRHDGEAATIENFVTAMEDASGRDLSQFTHWYSQAGTPRVTVVDDYDESAQTYSLTFKQACPDTPEATAADKKPFHIPVAIGLLGDAGNLPIYIQGQTPDFETADNTHAVIEITKAEQTFVFEKLSEQPTPVLLRGFSAPVKLTYDYSRDQLMAIMSRDDDGFSRWDAGQKLAVEIIQEVMSAYRASDGDSEKTYVVDSRLIDAFKAILSDTSLDKAMVALMLQLPTEAYLSEIAEEIDVEAIHFARNYVKGVIANRLSNEITAAYQDNLSNEAFSVSANAIAQRSLKNTLLSYLAALASDDSVEVAVKQFEQSTNMTDEMASLTALVNSAAGSAPAQSQRALADFYEKWQHEALVVNQWLVAQATCSLDGGLERVKQLMTHPSFDIKNPNKVRSVIGAFCGNNPNNFHRTDGLGYEFLADQIIVLNKLNPQIAARLVTPLTKWKKYNSGRQAQMRQQLERIKAVEGLSKDVFEVVSKSLVA